MKYVAFFIFCLLAVTAFAPEGVAQIRLNEILGDPGTDWNGDGAVDSKLDEWVEVVNVGSSAVDLSKYRISDASAATEFRFALSGMIGPGEVKVYFGSDVVAWQAANGVGQLGLSLNNAGDTVFLYEVNGAETLVNDTYTYATAEVADDRSVGRLPQGSGACHANWFLGGAVIVRDGAPVIGPSGMPLMREFWFPASDVEVIDTWTSTGLRGTASHDFSVTDVFVPDTWAGVFGPGDLPVPRTPYYCLPSGLRFPFPKVGVAVGVARAAMAAFDQLARTKKPSFLPELLAERLREDARAEFGCAARRKRHDQADRLVRILRKRAGAGKRGGNGGGRAPRDGGATVSPTGSDV